jgi:hypothetical protein
MSKKTIPGSYVRIGNKSSIQVITFSWLGTFQRFFSGKY